MNVVKGRPSARRLPLEWGSGEGVTEASLTPANMQGGCFEPRTWCSVGELLTNCTKPALQQHASDNVNKVLVGNKAEMDESKRVLIQAPLALLCDFFYFSNIGSNRQPAVSFELLLHFTFRLLL